MKMMVDMCVCVLGWGVGGNQWGCGEVWMAAAVGTVYKYIWGDGDVDGSAGG